VVGARLTMQVLIGGAVIVGVSTLILLWTSPVVWLILLLLGVW